MEVDTLEVRARACCSVRTKTYFTDTEPNTLPWDYKQHMTKLFVQRCMHASTYLYPQVMRNAAAALKEVVDHMRSSVVLTHGHQREDAALVLDKSCIAEANKVRCSDDDPILIIVTKMLLHTLYYTQMITRAETLPT